MPGCGHVVPPIFHVPLGGKKRKESEIKPHLSRTHVHWWGIILGVSAASVHYLFFTVF